MRGRWPWGYGSVLSIIIIIGNVGLAVGLAVALFVGAFCLIAIIAVPICIVVVFYVMSRKPRTMTI